MDVEVLVGKIIVYTLLMVTLFNIKHLVIDFFLQFPYMWKNKHKLFHPGGWLHAGAHAVSSFALFFLLTREVVPGVATLCFMEMLAHFFIDMAKMRLNTRMKWTATTSPHFWNLLGIDQFLHQMTYVVMIFAYMSL